MKIAVIRISKPVERRSWTKWCIPLGSRKRMLGSVFGVVMVPLPAYQRAWLVRLLPFLGLLHGGRVADSEVIRHHEEWFAKSVIALCSKRRIERSK